MNPAFAVGEQVHLSTLTWRASALLQISGSHAVNIDRMLTHSGQPIAAVLEAIPVGPT